ncbi:MAG: hypothetical protein QOD68_3067 [Actinomycetota bacterium]|nr:hypothetical protein [Actinomycetota bacterium]
MASTTSRRVGLAVGAQRTVPLSIWAIAVLLPVGPAAIAVLRLILPYYTASDSEGMVAAVDANPGQQSAVLWLAYVGILTLVPGVFAAAGVCRSAAPRLTAWALALSVPGYLSLGMLVGPDHLLWSTHAAGLSAGESAAVVSAAHPSVDVAIGVFVLGHVIGTVLLGLALLRSGRIPAWAGWAVAVSQPLHFVATVILGSPKVDFVAWTLTASGMAMVARALVRDPSAV